MQLATRSRRERKKGNEMDTGHSQSESQCVKPAIRALAAQGTARQDSRKEARNGQLNTHTHTLSVSQRTFSRSGSWETSQPDGLKFQVQCPRRRRRSRWDGGGKGHAATHMTYFQGKYN